MLNKYEMMTEEKCKKPVEMEIKKEKQIQEARDKVRQANLELLEIDNLFVIDTKNRLQNMIFSKQIITVLGAGSRKKQINASLVAFYLSVNDKIYVKEENISFDFDNWLCNIKLSSKETAKIPIKNATGIKSLTPHK